MASPVTHVDQIQIGDYYEDCAYHPCLCISLEEDGAEPGDEICGVSLVDGSWPRCCSVLHCGIRKLTLKEALIWKFYGPQELPDGEQLEQSGTWWSTNVADVRLFCTPPDASNASGD